MTARTKTEKLTDVGPDELESVVAEYEDAGSRSVVAVRQDDGKWTVTAIVPVEDAPR